MTSWTLRNVKPEVVDNLRTICENSKGAFSATLEPGGATYEATCTIPQPQLSPSPSPAALVPAAMAKASPAAHAPTERVITVDDRRLDALARVAQSEVGHFGKYGSAQLAGGLAAVVDTVINRVAHEGYPDTIEAVIDQPQQFSAVNKHGTWTGLPAARTDIMDIVRTHLVGRAAGADSPIKGSTHFLNPYLSSPKAMKSWGEHVKTNAVAVYGDDKKKDVHYHGFPPGGTLPAPYTLSFNNVSAAFNGDGTSAGADLRDAIV